jgi:hypothetical protein
VVSADVQLFNVITLGPGVGRLFENFMRQACQKGLRQACFKLLGSGLRYTRIGITRPFRSFSDKCKGLP